MTTNIELADRLARRRARAAMILGIVLLATQTIFAVDTQGPLRLVEIVQLAAWTVWIAVILVFILYGGGLFRDATVRSLMNDEGSEQNRRAALVAGFWATIAAAAICYAITFYEAVGARQALHIVITVGVGAALLRFGALERRALAE